MNKVVFNDEIEFNNYLRSNKPKEIWLDEFSKDIPYIYISNYGNLTIRGAYTSQTLLVHDIDKLYLLFEKGMYCKF